MSVIHVCIRSSLRKQIDYLMYCWRPQLGSQNDELYEIIKYGFKDPQTYKVSDEALSIRKK